MSDEDKEEKPKKAFQIKIVVWDDGEVDTDMREYKKLGTGRGAPTLCGPLSPKDLFSSFEDYGIDPEDVFLSIKNDVVGMLLDKTTDSVKVQPIERSKTDLEYNPQSEIVEKTEEEDTGLDLDEDMPDMDFDLED